MGKKEEWPKNGWMLIDPKYVGDGKGSNVHVLPVVYTARTPNGLTYKVPKYKTIEGCSIDVDESVSHLDGFPAYLDDKEGRAALIAVPSKLHDRNLKICANCIGHFCSDKEEER